MGRIRFCGKKYEGRRFVKNSRILFFKNEKPVVTGGFCVFAGSGFGNDFLSENFPISSLSF